MIIVFEEERRPGLYMSKEDVRGVGSRLSVSLEQGEVIAT